MKTPQIHFEQYQLLTESNLAFQLWGLFYTISRGCICYNFSKIALSPTLQQTMDSEKGHPQKQSKKWAVCVIRITGSILNKVLQNLCTEALASFTVFQLSLSISFSLRPLFTRRRAAEEKNTSCALVRADRRSRERQSTGVVTNQPKQPNFITYNIKIPHSFGIPISQLPAQTGIFFHFSSTTS